MSPGYDHEQHQGFERPVDVDCLVCHCGGIEEVDGAFHRLNVGELAIGCERCHGPGEAHSNLPRECSAAAKVHTVTAPIDPIINPLELRRCHALACAEYSARAASPELSAEFRGRALRELQELTIEAPQDGEVAAALAWSSREVGDLEAAKVAAQRALRSTNLSSGGRVNSLFVAGDVLLLGLARFQTGNQQAGLADVEHAQRISPFRQDIAETLVKLRKATVSRAGLKSQE
jgi:hypothetical protein